MLLKKLTCRNNMENAGPLLPAHQVEPVAENGPKLNLKNQIVIYIQRPYRKDRLPRYFYCCRQLANLRILQGICLYNALVWIVCYKPAGQSFPGCGVWGSVDFDSKYKILWGETRAHGLPIHEEKKVQNKNLHNYSNISTPYSIRLTHVGGGGSVLPSRLSQWYANLASSRQLFWLVDLPLDVYLFYMGFGITPSPLFGKWKSLNLKRDLIWFNNFKTVCLLSRSKRRYICRCLNIN